MKRGDKTNNKAYWRKRRVQEKKWKGRAKRWTEIGETEMRRLSDPNRLESD